MKRAAKRAAIRTARTGWESCSPVNRSTAFRFPSVKAFSGSPVSWLSAFNEPVCVCGSSSPSAGGEGHASTSSGSPYSPVRDESPMWSSLLVLRASLASLLLRKEGRKALVLVLSFEAEEDRERPIDGGARKGNVGELGRKVDEGLRSRVSLTLAGLGPSARVEPGAKPVLAVTLAASILMFSVSLLSLSLFSFSASSLEARLLPSIPPLDDLVSKDARKSRPLAPAQLVAVAEELPADDDPLVRLFSKVIGTVEGAGAIPPDGVTMVPVNGRLRRGVANRSTSSSAPSMISPTGRPLPLLLPPSPLGSALKSDASALDMDKWPTGFDVARCTITSDETDRPSTEKVAGLRWSFEAEVGDASAAAGEVVKSEYKGVGAAGFLTMCGT